MVYFFLILFVLAISFLVVRVGAIAFELTGLNSHQANFQALSCFTGTGFTTRESELIVNHPLRRKIASWLMIAGNIIFVTMIGFFVNTIAMSRELDSYMNFRIFSYSFHLHYALFLIIEILVFFLVFYVLHIFFMRSVLWRILQNYIKRKLKNLEYFSRVQFEELLIASDDCGMIRVKVEEGSVFDGKALKDSEIRTKLSAQVLAIERLNGVIFNPSADEKITSGDFLILFGNVKEISKKLNDLERGKI